MGRRRALTFGVVLALWVQPPLLLPQAVLSQRQPSPARPLAAPMAVRPATSPLPSPAKTRSQETRSQPNSLYESRPEESKPHATAELNSAALAFRTALHQRLGAVVRDRGWIGSFTASGWPQSPD